MAWDGLELIFARTGSVQVGGGGGGVKRSSVTFDGAFAVEHCDSTLDK